jgi:hypothetical protein
MRPRDERRPRRQRRLQCRTLSYTIDDRDNQSPRNGDTFGSGDTIGAPGTFYNLPYSYRHRIAAIGVAAIRACRRRTRL